MPSRDERRTPRRQLVGWGVLLATLLIALPADGARLKTRSQSETFDVGLGTATAECEPREKVISGGFANPDFTEDNFAGPQIITYESYKQSQTEWTVSGENVSLFEGTLTAYAYCRKGKGTKTKSESITIPGDETGTATAKCKRGQRVVSGGSMSPGYEYKGFASSVRPYESRKQGRRKWVVSGLNRSDTPSPLTAYAYCRKGKGTKTASKSTEIQPGPPGGGEAGTATAKCKRGQRVISGGFDVPDFDSDSRIRPYESLKEDGRRWRVSGVASFGPDPVTLTAYAYCEKKKKRR